MKFPNHILLDMRKSIVNYSSQYWILNYLSSLKNNNLFDSLSFHKKFLINKKKLFLNKLIADQIKFTVRYNYSNLAIFLNKNEKLFFTTNYQPRLKVKNRSINSNSYGKSIYDFLSNTSSVCDKKSFKRLFKNLSFKTNYHLFKSNNLWNLFNINFLKKEKIYTKLKYSRVPQYDIVSGGAAALFAGFLGFLITEKFGFELVDSGDFYFVFMYAVFFFFSCRLFLKLIDKSKLSWNIFSLKWLIYFYKIIFFLLIKFYKNLINKFLN